MVRARFIKAPGPRDVGPEDNFEVGGEYLLTQRSFDRWKQLGCVELIPDDPAPAVDAAPDAPKPEPRIVRAGTRNRYHVLGTDGARLSNKPLTLVEAEQFKANHMASSYAPAEPEKNESQNGAGVSPDQAEFPISH